VENNAIIKYEGGLIQRVGNAISVTNKLLASAEPQLIPYRKKDKWGFCTPDKKIVIDCVYDEVERFYEGLAAVRLNKRFGFIDKSGRQIMQCIYDDVQNFSGGLSHILLDYKYGFANKTGEIVIPCIYDSVENLSNGCALMKNFNENEGERTSEFINIKNGKIIAFEYWHAEQFSEGLAEVHLNEKWGYINVNGQIVIPYLHDYSRQFSEGLAAVRLDGRWGYIDKDGKQVIPFEFGIADIFLDGLAPVEHHGECIYIDKEGKSIIRWPYDDYQFSSYFYHASPFLEGLASVRLESHNESQIDPFEEYFRIENDYYYAQANLGFINKRGEVVIPFIYNSSDGFSEGLANVELNGKFGYIDKFGNEVIPFVLTIT